MTPLSVAENGMNSDVSTYITQEQPVPRANETGLLLGLSEEILGSRFVTAVHTMSCAWLERGTATVSKQSIKAKVANNDFWMG
ncbi:MAG: hypothetical protein K2X93_05895 [Candidatus Obscuribacterales bacterium]|nr:hypothetical protein [Candidatus Obscuribacterales bacterium]